MSGRAKTPRSKEPEVPRKNAMKVLGSMIGPDVLCTEALAHRRGLLEKHKVLHPKKSLVGSASETPGCSSSASAALGAESIPASIPARRSLSTLQCQCLGKMISIVRRPSETQEEFSRRRNRCISGATRRHSRGLWGALQHFRFHTMLGHVARLTEQHWVASAVQWRDTRWPKRHDVVMPLKKGGQRGRRPPGLGQPHRHERSLLDAWRAFHSLPAAADARRALCPTEPDELGFGRRPWQEAAACRDYWRLFCRWAAFVRRC